MSLTIYDLQVGVVATHSANFSLSPLGRWQCTPVPKGRALAAPCHVLTISCHCEHTTCHPRTKAVVPRKRKGHCTLLPTRALSVQRSHTCIATKGLGAVRAAPAGGS